jgi:hypothetical protein
VRLRFSTERARLIAEHDRLLALYPPLPPKGYCISCGAKLLGNGGQTGVHCGPCNAAIGSM